MENKTRSLFTVIFSFLTVLALGQQGEYLAPLEVNPNAKHYQEYVSGAQQKATSGDFIYLIDTFDITDPLNPFRDDFSGNRFKQYTAQPGDPGVLDTLLYDLYIAGMVAPIETQLFGDTTYRIEITITSTDTIVDSIPLPSTMVEVHNNCVWPPVMVTREGWPSYNLIDSFVNGMFDTITRLPTWTQDSTRLFIVAAEDTSLWQDEFVFVNNTLALDPPTIGVATFDGLDENGFPYDFSSPISQGQADYLTSMPINLDFSPGDDVALSFFYQAEGIGNDPQPEDSLVLEYLNGTTGRWDVAWTTPGMSVAAFEKVYLPIMDLDYLYNGFQFRFRNKATLSGNLDHWHLDFVELGINRNIADVIDEVAFVNPFNGILGGFTQMPWRHFKTTPEVYMADSVETVTRNLNNISENIVFTAEVAFNGTTLNTFNDQSNTMNNASSSFVENHWFRAFNSFVYDTALADTHAYFDVKIATTTFGIPTNDELNYRQELWNQYAYDDGSAEAAYGILGTGSRVAYRFNSVIADTLTSAYMYFNPTVEDVSNEAFFLYVWAADGPGGEPGTILSANQFTFSKPEYRGHNVFQRVELETPVVVSGAFYIGWLQLADVRMNIGFDRNINTAENIYFNSTGVWNTTAFTGSLMLRPAFKTDRDFILSTPEQEVEALEIRVFPNPATTSISITGTEGRETTVQLFDLSGRQLFNEAGYINRVDLNDFSAGVYLLHITDQNTGTVATERVVIQK